MEALLNTDIIDLYIDAVLRWNIKKKPQNILNNKKRDFFFPGRPYQWVKKTWSNSVSILVLLLNVHLILNKLYFFVYSCFTKSQDSLLQNILSLIGGKSTGRLKWGCCDDIASVLVLFCQCVMDIFLFDIQCLYTSKVTISWQWKSQHSFCRHPVLNKAQPQSLVVSSLLSSHSGIFSLSVHHTLPSFLLNPHNPIWNLVSVSLTFKDLVLVFFFSDHPSIFSFRGHFFVIFCCHVSFKTLYVETDP